MRKLISSILIMAILSCTCLIGSISAQADTTSPNANFLERFKEDATLVFNDDFDGNALDTTKWNYSRGWGRNQELYGHAEDDNVRVEDGNLVLEARAETRYNTTTKKEGYHTITAGEITTNGKAAWANGLIEVRAKLPMGEGVYPAIWTMGFDYDVGGTNWPWSGEIDIMEAIGEGDDDASNSSTWQTLHHAKQNSESVSHSAAHVATGVGSYTTSDKSALNDEYHSFWVYFDDEVMIIGVDETMMNIVEIDNDDLREFTEYEQFLIIGMQMGGNSATGDISINYTENSVWQMLVDHVKVYRFEDKSAYDDYTIVEAENYDTDCSVGTTTNLCSGTTVKAVGSASLNSVIRDLDSGTYDIYAAIRTSETESTYIPYIAGTEISDVTVSTLDENADGDTPYIGTVKVTDDDIPFEIVFKNTKAASSNTTNLEVDKYFFVKSEANPDAVVSEDNCYVAQDKITVSTAADFVTALTNIEFGGTIIFDADITLTNACSITKDMTIDLNSHTLSSGTLKQGISISADSTACTIKNGTIVADGSSGVMNYFIDMAKATVLNLDNIDLKVGAYKHTKSGYVLIGSPYTSGGKTVNVSNSTVTLTRTSLDLTSGYQHNAIFGATNAAFSNSTLDGKGLVDMLYIQGVANSSNQFTFKNCTIKNFVTVIECGTDVKANLYPFKFAETQILNCTNLSNSESNAQKFYPTTNNTRYSADDTELTADDITNSISTLKFICSHEYADATCTASKTCKYCGITSGKGLGHTPGEAVITESDCLHDGTSVISCTVCDEVLSKTVTSIAKGHVFNIEQIGELSCTSFPYYKRTCTECGHYETFSGTTGTYGKLGHTVDLTKEVTWFDDCKIGSGYYYTCAACGTENLRMILNLGAHKLTVDSITDPTETENGIINYKCTIDGCDYTEQSEAIPYNTPIITIGDMKYPAIDGLFVTPYVTDNCFVGYKCGDTMYDGNETITVTEDITLEPLYLSLDMLKGASMRFTNHTGIRFYTTINKDELAYLKEAGATVELGTLISTKDNVGGDHLEMTMKGIYSDVKFESTDWFIEDDFSGFVGSIVDIKETNLNREYMGRGYATITIGDYRKTIYADYENLISDNNSRTICYIANCVKNDTAIYNALPDSYKLIVDDFTSKYEAE